MNCNADLWSRELVYFLNHIEPVWVLNKQGGKSWETNLQIEKVDNGVDWVIDPSCIAKCEVEKAETEKESYRLKKKLRVSLLYLACVFQKLDLTKTLKRVTRS